MRVAHVAIWDFNKRRAVLQSAYWDPVTCWRWVQAIYVCVRGCVRVSKCLVTSLLLNLSPRASIRVSHRHKPSNGKKEGRTGVRDRAREWVLEGTPCPPPTATPASVWPPPISSQIRRKPTHCCIRAVRRGKPHQPNDSELTTAHISPAQCVTTQYDIKKTLKSSTDQQHLRG